MAPPRKLRSLVGALIVGAAAAALVGCRLLPEDCRPGKDRKDGKDLKGLKDAKLLKLFKPPEPQVPVIPELVPPAPVPPPPSALNLAPGAPPPGPPTVWAKLGLSAEQREYRRRALVETPFGKLLGAVTAPLSAVTLGLIPAVKPPPVPTLGQLLDKGPIGANSKVKLDRLNAKKRKEAVEGLRGVNCHYWPEAEEALLAALRTDRNEGVRYTAAQVLASGNCCTKKTIEALSVCASGSDRDGAPCEVSGTIRAAAAKALKKCLDGQCQNRCGVKYGPCPTVAPGPVPDERPREEEEPRVSVQPASAKPGPHAAGESEEAARQVRMAAYYVTVEKKSDDAVLAAARTVLERVQFPPGADAVPAGHPDYEAVDLYPDAAGAGLAAAASPRPEGLFDRPHAAVRTPIAATPRDPSRPANVFDLFLAPAPAEPIGPAGGQPGR